MVRREREYVGVSVIEMGEGKYVYKYEKDQ